jgi:hypothetical protein
MACEVQINSVNYLQKQGAIDEANKVVNEKLFDDLNDKMTSLAEIKYGLEPLGEKLFNLRLSEAVPNDALFETFQDLFNSRPQENTVVPDETSFDIDVSLYGVDLVELDIEQLQNQRSKQLAEVLTQRLSRGLDVRYENVTKEEATRILQNRQVKYNGEPGFYYAGTVYLVGENITPRTVLHEFSHPLLQGLRMKNNILFQKLYKEAISMRRVKVYNTMLHLCILN